jgi:hypothetical protein
MDNLEPRVTYNITINLQPPVTIEPPREKKLPFWIAIAWRWRIISNLLTLGA